MRFTERAVIRNKTRETINMAEASVRVSLRKGFAVYLPESRTEGGRRQEREGLWLSVRQMIRWGVGFLSSPPLVTAPGTVKSFNGTARGVNRKRSDHLPFRSGRDT
jgi:hypothetical protein